MKFGVVGTAWITDSFLESLLQYDGIELECVVSPRRENVERFKNKYGFKTAFTDFEEMINASEIDILYIASPNAFHFDQTKKALTKKINVICEKPITLSLQELEELLRTAKENNVYFIEGMRVVHHPHTYILKEHLNKLDGISYANLKFMRYSSKYDSYKRNENPAVFASKAGGALNDLGVYPITLAVLLFGEPKEVTSHSMVLETGADATTTSTLVYDNFFVNCNYSKISNTYSYNEIQGESNALLLSHVTHLDKIIYKDDNKEEVLLDKSIDDDMKFEIKAIMDIVKKKDNEEFLRLYKITEAVTKICDKIRR